MKIFMTVISLAMLACTAQASMANPPTPQTVTKEDSLGALTDTVDQSHHSLIGTIVSVTRETVNLRTQEHVAIGSFVKIGETLTVDCGPDGYCEILEGEHAGLYIWRGCTSDPAGYGCQAK